MSLSAAMYSGISGLMVYGDAMNVTGDNIANINTTGFKSSRAIFADILANSVANGSATLQFGRGALISNVTQEFSQGSFESTGNATDMAIQGTGFFVVRDKSSGGMFYTRAGQFTLNKDGLLVNPNDAVVQGYKMSTNASGAVTRSGTASDIDITGVQSTPRETSIFRLGINLNAAASAGATFSTSFNAYNSLGETTTVTYTFTKQTTAQTWNYVAASSIGSVTAGASGSVTFNSAGQITAPTTDQSMTVSGFGSGAGNLTMAWNLRNDAAGIPYYDVTGYAAESVTSSVVQDGYSTGVLRGTSVDQEGIISGLFSNGQTQQLWQIELADFLSPWGLSRQGNSLFAETRQSGQPILGIAKAGGFGTIYGSSLELSNVDLGQQFVDMIANQRAYQANSRIITTVDTMLQEAINLKR
ncbi:Flagellar hook protein FlgE [hydrothermal vent metagenome]|uniref:Flagellar hook protein FlgE n=1 Tax=hydrothermal vent metagenome TaxID=652676 RepID=A0A3B1CIW1_9ZZZZ